MVDFKNQINQLIFCRCCKKRKKKRRQHRVNNIVDNNDSNNDDDCIFSFCSLPFTKMWGDFFICDWLEFSFGFWFSDCFSPSLKNRCQKTEPIRFSSFIGCKKIIVVFILSPNLFSQQMIPSISENYKYSEFFPPFPFTFSNSSSFFSPTSIHFVYIYYNLLNPPIKPIIIFKILYLLQI